MIFSNKNIKQGFTLLELMFFLAFITMILVASAPLITRKAFDVPNRISHGTFVCKKDNNNNYQMQQYTNNILTSNTTGERCSFTPPRNVQLFKIELIGTGAGGYDEGKKTIEVGPDDMSAHNFSKTYNLRDGFTPDEDSIMPSGEMLYEVLNNRAFKLYQQKDNAEDGEDVELFYNCLHPIGIGKKMEEIRVRLSSGELKNYVQDPKYEITLSQRFPFRNEPKSGYPVLQAITNVINTEVSKRPRNMKNFIEFRYVQAYTHFDTQTGIGPWGDIMRKLQTTYKGNYVYHRANNNNDSFYYDLTPKLEVITSKGKDGGMGRDIMVDGRIDFIDYSGNNPQRIEPTNDDGVREYLNKLFTENIVLGYTTEQGNNANSVDRFQTDKPVMKGIQGHPDLNIDKDAKYYTEQIYRSNNSEPDGRYIARKDNINPEIISEPSFQRGGKGLDIVKYGALRFWGKTNLTYDSLPTGGDGGQMSRVGGKLLFNKNENHAENIGSNIVDRHGNVGNITARNVPYENLTFINESNIPKENRFPTIMWHKNFGVLKYTYGKGGGAGEYKVYHSTNLPDDCSFTIGDRRTFNSNTIQAQINNFERENATTLSCDNGRISYTALAGTPQHETSETTEDGHKYINISRANWPQGPIEYEEKGEPSKFTNNFLRANPAIAFNYGAGGKGKTLIESHPEPQGRIRVSVNLNFGNLPWQSYNGQLQIPRIREFVFNDNPDWYDVDIDTTPAEPGETGAIIISW